MKVIIIAAVSENNVIGNKGKIPWHSREDLLFFKETTVGFPVIFGRRTFESISRPLEKRINIVITTHPELFIKFKEVKCFFSLKEALDFCDESGFEKVFIAGGSQLYKEALKHSAQIILSRMPFECEGDKFFPEIESRDWAVESTEKRKEFEIFFYKRRVNELKQD